MSAPLLSVILPMPAGYAPIARTMQHLRAQTVRDRIELVIAAPPGSATRIDPANLDGFAATQVIEHDREASLSQIRAAGVRAATAPVVVFAEDHCYPAPTWADALIRAHEGAWAAVGPEFENGNPRSAMSWADFYLNFGRFAAPAQHGVASGLAWHNTSYKRSVLLECGDELASLLETEGLLQDRLRASGYELWLESAARVAHVNFSRTRWFLVGHVVSGRLYGAHRATEEHWSRARRAGYVVAGALTPLARVPGIVADIRRTRNHPAVVTMLPALVAGLVAHAAGEIVAYAFGAGRAAQQKSALEFNRHLYVTAADRAEMLA